jgi:hypothetical protein
MATFGPKPFVAQLPWWTSRMAKFFGRPTLTHVAPPPSFFPHEPDALP